MNTDQWLITAILMLTLVLFVWGKYRHDIVAAIALGLCVLAGLVAADEAFVGFSHPAVITVAAVLVISDALRRSGVVDVIVQKILPYTESPLSHILIMTTVVTVASAFMNNVGALALMLPVALATCSKHQRSPALILMPLAFGSILGGMTTAIGTPPNIIIAMMRAEASGESFSMFDFSPVGVAIAIMGVLFITLVGWRLIPAARLKSSSPDQLFAIDEYLTEVIVTADSSLVGKSVDEIDGLQDASIEIVGIAHRHGKTMSMRAGQLLNAGDILLLQADPSEVQPLLDKNELELITSADKKFSKLTQGELTLVEGVIKKGSVLEGRDVPFLRRRSGGSLALVGLAREGQHIRRLRRKQFKAGDILLLQGAVDDINERLSELGMIPLAERNINLGQPKKIAISLAIFTIAIALGMAKILPLAIVFCLAVIVYLLLDILPVRNLYDAIDWPVIILLSAMIPVGSALQSTGLTELLATQVLTLTQGMPVYLIIGLVLVVTMFLSDIINNAATAVIMAPLAYGIAMGLGVSADPFFMAVAVGASCAFLTPIGHQSNTLVLGPGGYAFGDYWRMGLPLEIMIVLLAVPLILLVWPL
ncbi:SLC13 family permease [Neptunomonas phycophila]|uniref:SLC13 family permease n=1 Tax=Neptunomonas phycophila TaxID=1572645 RepID=A0ABT9ERU2_9GAMM|nr:MULTISPECIES: SLC13 family permease [Neptunomonas]MDN2661469.1 SLC13 family permease [Neptunomonas sp. CHC150]MDO6467757.1 SLC13 family permease [Neptunomonas phycophila]MDP2521775.1 SLC13 family permease [Neptunomonas phycophila]QLE98243.1 SLC13 family permease [Neptunomonas phycophila]